MFDVVTIGTATRDVFIKSPLFKVLSDPRHLRKLGFTTGEAQCFAFGEKLEVEKPLFSVGGGAANAGVTFTRQGFKTAIVAKVGRDLSARDIKESLATERAISFLIPDTATGTAYSVVLLSPDGERTVLHYRGASKELEIGDVPARALHAKTAYINTGDIRFSVMRILIRSLKRNGSMIVLDPSAHYLKMGVRKLAPLLKMVDVMFMNREEASYLTGCRYEDEKGILRKVKHLVQGMVAITDGPRGVTVLGGRGLYRAGVYSERKIVDRLGAGDAFGSGFVAGLMRKSKIRNEKERIEYAIRLGSANATSVVEHIGAEVGILRKNDFGGAARWRHLKIHMQHIV